MDLIQILSTLWLPAKRASLQTWTNEADEQNKADMWEAQRRFPGFLSLCTFLVPAPSRGSAMFLCFYESLFPHLYDKFPFLFYTSLSGFLLLEMKCSQLIKTNMMFLKPKSCINLHVVQHSNPSPSQSIFLCMCSKGGKSSEHGGRGSARIHPLHRWQRWRWRWYGPTKQIRSLAVMRWTYHGDLEKPLKRPPPPRIFPTTKMRQFLLPTTQNSL